MVYSTRRFVVCISVCQFVLVFFSPFSITITSLGEERANLSAFCTFVQFVPVWICRIPLPLGVWEGLRFVIEALPGLFSYLFFFFFFFFLHRRQRKKELHYEQTMTNRIYDGCPSKAHNHNYNEQHTNREELQSRWKIQEHLLHYKNIPIWFWPPYTPLLFSKTGVYMGIHYFSYFCSKHRLWVLVRTASARWF